MIRLIIHRDSSPRESLYDPVAMKIYSGITSTLEKLNIDFDTLSENYLSSILLNCGAKSGFLILQTMDEGNVELLKQESMPFVFLHAPLKQEGIVSVMVNLKRGGYLATKYLTSLGHRRIGFVAGLITSPWSLPRFKGYRKALREEKIKFDWLLVKETEGIDPEEDENAVRELLSLPSPPTGIFAGNDYRAIHVLEYCDKNNIKVPEDLSIVGFDNVSESSLTSPALTTIETSLEKVGEEGVNILIKMMVGERRKTWKDIVIKPHLITRKSAEWLRKEC